MENTKLILIPVYGQGLESREMLSDDLISKGVSEEDIHHFLESGESFNFKGNDYFLDIAF